MALTGKAASKARRASSKASSSSSSASSGTRSSTANRNTSYTTADGRGVRIKDGVKTYYDKPINVKGRSGQSISGKDYSINKGGTGYDPNPSVITAEKMAPVTPINLPTPPPVDGLFGVTDSANASLAGAVGGTYDTTNKQIVPPTPVAAPSTASDIFKSYMDKQMGTFNEQTSSVDRLKEQQKMLRPKENAVNALTGQLNTITANRDAAMLGLEGQGRGQTAGFIGGEQARINREAAIQAMPIQAQLAIAQDDLESARSYASQLFQAQAADDLARYNFQKEVNASIYNFLNAEETRRMAAKEKEEDRAFAIAQDNRSTLKQLSLQALEYGQGALAAEVMRLDPNSPTFDTDYGDAMSRLRKPVVTSGNGAPQTQNIKRADGTEVTMQWNPATGTWEEISGGGTIAEAAGQKSLDQFSFLKKAIEEAKELADATGPNMITQGLGNVFVGNTRVKQLQNKIDSLKTNLLTLNTDPNVKKFFGPQMSNKDTELMLSAGSTLDAYNSSEQANRQELERYQSLITRMEKAVRDGLGQEQPSFQVNPNALPSSVYSRLQQPNIIFTPDGLQVEIID